MKSYLVIFIICLVGLISCDRHEDFGGESPSARNAKSIKKLRDELTSSPHGWQVMYFPKTDSLLFSNHEEILENQGSLQGRLGYGGFMFKMNFSKNGTVEMLSDINQESVSTPKESAFEIRQNTYTQLSFTTFNYIHSLVNQKFEGVSDFLYYGEDWEGNLIFKSGKTLSPAKEYIVFKKIKNADIANDLLSKSTENRQFFEAMKNPQIIIRRGGRVFFKSDVYMKSKAITNKPFIDEIFNKRFYIFSVAKKENLDPNIFVPVESSGLGSGYTGTYYGISFRAGIRYNKDLIFYDFEKQGNKFICELMRVYDHKRREFHYVPKHLTNEGEETGYIAEIWDETLRIN